MTVFRSSSIELIPVGEFQHPKALRDVGGISHWNLSCCSGLGTARVLFAWAKALRARPHLIHPLLAVYHDHSVTFNGVRICE